MVDLYRRMWFGTKERMSAVRAPKIDYSAPKIGWSGGTTQYLNGGAYVRKSTSAHKEYSLSWSNMSREEIRLINDYADGVYGSGPIYFLDPFAVDTNLLPQSWAAPRLVWEDGLVLTGSGRETVVDFANLATNTLGYPARGASYGDINATTPSAQRPRLYIPVPDGYTFWFGVHGQAYQSSPNIVQVKPSNGSATTVPLMSLSDSNRFSNSWDGTGDMTGVEISLTGPNGFATLHGMMAQVLPTGVLPKSGGFISGQGNSGVRFAVHPTLKQYSAAMDMVSLTAQLVEDESWR